MFNLLLDWEVERLRGGDKYFRDYVVLCEWDKEKDKDKDFRDDWCLCEVVPGPRQAKQVATERLFKFLLTQIPHPLLQLPLPLLLQAASNNNALGFLTVCTKNSVVHQTMLHQNHSTAVGDAPKVFKKCQIEQMSRPEHSQTHSRQQRYLDERGLAARGDWKSKSLWRVFSCTQTLPHSLTHGAGTCALRQSCTLL